MDGSEKKIPFTYTDGPKVVSKVVMNTMYCNNDARLFFFFSFYFFLFDKDRSTDERNSVLVDQNSEVVVH